MECSFCSKKCWPSNNQPIPKTEKRVKICNKCFEYATEQSVAMRKVLLKETYLENRVRINKKLDKGIRAERIKALNIQYAEDKKNVETDTWDMYPIGWWFGENSLLNAYET